MPHSYGAQGADPFVFQGGGVALGEMASSLRTTNPKCTEGRGGRGGEDI